MRDAIFGKTVERRGSITISEDVSASIGGADVVYTDVWISMGEDVSIDDRIKLLTPYRVTKRVMSLTGKDRSIFMHCLPSFHDLETEMARAHPDLIEVEDEVFEHAQSRVFDQAENRMHSIKALMLETV
jgi:ornithine carbamoyltransferase